jgi:predicted lipoprotein with Yx(FWY)xxD motif
VGAVLCLGFGSLIAACNSGPVATLTAPPTTDPSLTLVLEHSPEGSILATGRGATLYDFGPDSPTRSTCVNVGCVYQWPPLAAPSSIRVGAGVTRSFVGTVKRPGGSLQLTYDGHPLYTYVRDVKPGMVTGQAIDQDGGPWYVLNPTGHEIRSPFTVNG